MKLKPADFARQAGVTRQAVGAKIKNNTLAVDAAGFLDTENPINSAYISDQGRRSRPAAPVAPLPTPGGIPASPAPPAPLALQGDEQISAAAGVPAELLTYSLRELVVRYNGMINLEKHARILRESDTPGKTRGLNGEPLKAVCYGPPKGGCRC